jgi:hypothetical protein
MTGQFLYLAASLAGVAAMVGLCVLLFGRGVATITAESAEARLRDDIPGFRAGAVAISSDSHAALVEDARDRSLHLVIARGSGLVLRTLSRDMVRKATRNGSTLDLRLADFTFSKARVAFAEEQSASDWEARLSHAS